MPLCERCKLEIEEIGRQELPPMFDFARQAVKVDGELRPIPGVRWQILLLLWRRRGLSVRNERIIEFIWGYAGDGGNDDNLKVQMFHLRRALKGSPYAIGTVHGVGYILESAEAIPTAGTHRVRY